MTDQVNAVIKSTATYTGSAYVDLRAAFKGLTTRTTRRTISRSDGDHPNNAGHEQIADGHRGRDLACARHLADLRRAADRVIVARDDVVRGAR